MMKAGIAAGVAGLIALGMMVISSAPSPRDDKHHIVVVRGRDSATNVVSGPVETFMPIATPSSNLTPVEKHAFGLTKDESAEVEKMVDAVRNEPREGPWAEAAERTISTTIDGVYTAKADKSDVRCGSTSCSVSIRIDGAASDYNKQQAMESLEQQRPSDGQDVSMFVSRMFSEHQADGSFVIHALLVRS